MIPEMKTFTEKDMIDVLEACAYELMNYYQQSQDKEVLATLMNAEDAKQYLFCKMYLSNPTTTIH